MQAKALVRHDVVNLVSVLTIDNPPVNALGRDVREALLRAVEVAAGNSETESIVIIGANGVFIAGAHVREFEGPPLDPQFPELINAIEQVAKPVVAAISGVALGGGLEVALGCHYRVADSKAKMGLPEVSLGIMPGAGGTVRLPRLIGPEAAIDLGTTGRRVGASEALSLGLVDCVIDGDLLARACQFASEQVARGPRRLSEASMVSIPDERFLREQATKLKKLFKGQTSPMVALETFRAGLDLDFDEALANERRVFLKLRHTQQAKALRHVFFAERRAWQVPEIEGIEPDAVTCVAVLGGGSMGSDITTRLLLSGYEIVLVELKNRVRLSAAQRIFTNLDAAVMRGKLDTTEKERLIGRLSIVGDLADIAGSDLVIEAVYEDVQVKSEVFAALDRVIKPGATLATNTSYLDIDSLATVTGNPADVLGLHFFSPAHVMRLLEIIKGRQTSARTLARGFALARRLGMVAVCSGVCEGFIGNRILEKTRQVAFFLIAHGVLPCEVDDAMESFGMAMGPFRVMDLAGLDIGWARRRARALHHGSDEYYSGIADRLCEFGWFGRKTGRGWYRYDNGETRGSPDAEVEAMVREFARENAISRRKYPASQIQQRLLLTMINEAARILGEGFARRASDIDLVKIHGYGFPRWRGGPTHCADQIGLAEVVKQIEALAADDDLLWSPAPLLVALARDGATFASFDEDRYL